MPNVDFFLFFYLTGFAGLGAVIYLVFVNWNKMEKIKELLEVVETLRRSLDEMDEQAKLIVRTDMELNKTQEELDKKMTGLYTLQRLSRSISTTLQESEIFKRISPDDLKDIGFEKTLIITQGSSDKEFLIRFHLGYSAAELASIQAAFHQQNDFFTGLINNEQTIASATDPAIPQHAELSRFFNVTSFVLSPILPKEGAKGLFFVGTSDSDTVITEGDEELINILANQLGQAMENARLFEKTWKAQQELEKKVEQRTKELTIALDEVRQINRRKTDFVSSVSHELRTPLTSIKGYAAILLAGKLGELPVDIRERLSKINQHSDELVHMVNDLLDISRIEAGKVTMKQESLELKAIAEKVADLLGEQLKAKHINMVIEIPAQASAVFADRSHIERVLINLLGNALKFTPEHGTISIKSRAADNNIIQIDVTDTGCGIPPDMQEKIFEEFYRVENAINEQVKGTGLGLALVKHIIEAHRGTIWVKSNEGAGSTFSFTLPKPA
ncbi:MAG: hypothetical protein KBA46_04555 [Candidatus Omnitrophica bacterium]|nr:hypothetical protein [Candidatus Omnitrophota bacterium]